jgi:hypothetical protein
MDEKPRLSVVRSVIEQKLDEKVKEGQIAGIDRLTEKEADEWLFELAKLYVANRIVYDQKRNLVLPWFQCGVRALDAEVKKLITQDAPPPEEDPVNELIAIAKQEDLWHDAALAGYATLDHEDGHVENHQLKSAEFGYYLADKYGEIHQREFNGELEPCYPSRNDVKEAVWKIEHHARRGDQREPRIRIKESYDGNSVWIDLGTADWSCIRVDADDWKPKRRMRVPLIRGTGMLPLPEPKRGGNIRDLRRFVNVRDEDFVLLCGFTATILNPFSDFMTALLSGPPGSAKTEITRIIRGLTDPHKVSSRHHASARDLKHGAIHTHVVALENQRKLSEDFSDVICQLNTGLDYGEREFREQGKEFQLSTRCPVIINGIASDIVDQPDLLDRTVTFRCDYLGNEMRSKEVFRRRFADAAPMLFGALLDGLVGAMRSRKEFGLDNDEAALSLLDGWRPRFVDAAVWAEAACRAMGFEPGEYASALKNNKDAVFRDIAESEPICIGIKKLMTLRSEWRGLPAELCKAIQPYIAVPVYENWLARDLPSLIPALDKVHGIKVLMKQRLPNDNNNSNGIVISVVGIVGIVGISGTALENQTAKEEETTTETTTTNPGKGFVRRI